MGGQHAGSDDKGYVAVAVDTAVREGVMLVADVDGRRLILTRVEEEIIAFDALCPHAATDLSDGALHRGRIDCPNHGYRFDIRSGRTLWPPDEMVRLRRYPVRVAEGVVSVQLSSPP